MHPATPQGTAVISSPSSTVVVIPARYHSTRLPGKPLADIDGRPMIEHVYRRAVGSARVTGVIVATDDQRVADAVAGFGGEVRLTAAEHRNGTERLAEVARDLSCHLIVNVQGDEPLVDPRAIDAAVGVFEDEPDLCVSTLRAPLTDPDDLDNPHVVKVVVDQHDFALYFSRAAIPHQAASDQAVHPGRELGWKHIGLYVYRRDFLLRVAAMEPTPLEQAERLEQLRVLEHGYRIKTVLTTHDPIGVDTPEDLERVRRIVRSGASQ